MTTDGVAIVRLSGEVDLTRALSLRDELMNAVGNRHLGLVVDLTEATYLDSAGVNLLFEVAELLAERQLQMALVVPEGSLVERVVTLVDLGSVVPIERDAEAAMARIRRG